MVILSPKKMLKFIHLMWTPKCVRILPKGLPMELLNGWKIRHPNWFILSTVTIWIPSESIATPFGFLPFNKCSLPGYFGKFQPPSSIISFPLHLIIHLDHALVGTTTNISCELGLTSKNRPWIDSNEKSTNCSTSTSWFTTLFSTCSSSSKSL